MARGKLILISGGNGTGKDELTKRLPELLKEKGVEAIGVYGPRANPSASAMRDIILSDELHPHSRLSQAFLWLAQHAETAHQAVMPMLEHQNVILNRGVESTLIYNVLERGLEADYPSLREAAQEILRDLAPDLVMVLDVPVAISLQRSAKQDETDHLQREAEPVHTRRRAFYQQLAAEHDWTIVDASPDAATVAKNVTDLIIEKLFA